MTPPKVIIDGSAIRNVDEGAVIVSVVQEWRPVRRLVSRDFTLRAFQVSHIVVARVEIEVIVSRALMDTRGHCSWIDDEVTFTYLN